MFLTWIWFFVSIVWWKISWILRNQTRILLRSSIAPPDGWWKINFDAAFVNGQAGIALVVRDCKGNLLHFASNSVCCGSPFEVELKAFTWAANMAINRNWENICWLSDSTLVVDGIIDNEDPATWTSRYDFLFLSPIPSEILRLTNLISLDLSYYFEVPCPFCEFIGDYYPNIQEPELLRSLAENITSLRKLHLGGLNFSSSNLLSLELSSTKFGGKLPYSIGNLTSLNVLDLTNCKFSGPVPYSLGNLANISQLHLDGNEFTGEFPSSLGNLMQISYLDLSNNFFHGSLPISLPYLLDDVNFKNNSFTGPVPFQFFSNLTLLRTLDLSSNSLNGVIPSSLCSLVSYLNLDDNQFTDLENINSISSQLGYLSLNRNKLKGSIPNSIFKLKSLTSLSLGSNNLSGRVDLGIF
nr:receptor-like protein 35 [Ziziphus jujuba var. spinosa]